MLKNPPVVAPIRGEQRYVVLDGANRVTAIRALGFGHIAVQVVDYEDAGLILDAWHHLVKDVSAEEFKGLLHAVQGVELERAEAVRARARLARREIVAFVEYVNGEVWTLRASGDLHQRTRCLNEIVDRYRIQGRVFRVNVDHLPSLLASYDAIAALVVFPRFAPEEIVDLARVGACLPAGITRHVVAGRALRINLPLAMLGGSASLPEKNAWLVDWLKQKVASRSVRYYQESTFLIDE